MRIRGCAASEAGVPTMDGPSAEDGDGSPVSAGHIEEVQTVKPKEIIMEKKLSVEGMMCQHCVAHVKKALEGIEGVEEAVVDLDSNSATAKLSRRRGRPGACRRHRRCGIRSEGRRVARRLLRGQRKSYALLLAR